MARAFSGDMRPRVGLVTERAFIRQGMAISFGYFAVIVLAVNEFEKGGALLGVACQHVVKGMAQNLLSGPFLFVGEDETYIKRKVV